MRILIKASLILLLTLAPFNSKSFFYRNKQFVLISFNVTINEYVKARIDEHKHLFPPHSNPKVDPVKARIKQRVWVHLEERIVREVGLYVLPLNAYGEQFSYDIYGFPDMPINRALRRGTSRFYLRVDLNIDAQGIPDKNFLQRQSRNQEGSEQQEPEIKPQITLTLIAHNDKGVMPIDRQTAIIVSPEPTTFSADFLNGFINGSPTDDMQTLFDLIDTTISYLITKMPN